MQSVIDQFGRIDCLVNNAGIGEVTKPEYLDERAFERTLRVNLVGAFLVSQAAGPHLKDEGGRLVFISSNAARTGGCLCRVERGIEGPMHYYSTYLRPHRITANAIAPAMIETDMLEAMSAPPPDQLPLLSSFPVPVIPKSLQRLARRTGALLNTAEAGGACRHVAIDLCPEKSKRRLGRQLWKPDALAHATGRGQAEYSSDPFSVINGNIAMVAI